MIEAVIKLIAALSLLADAAAVAALFWRRSTN
jgi:hypothetical protein